MINKKNILVIIFSSIIFGGIFFYTFLKKEEKINTNFSFKSEFVQKYAENIKPTSSSALPHKRIIFLTLESIRHDHLHFMEYFRHTTDFSDHLLKNSILFENMYTPIPYTSPSHSSMFTSLYPTDTNMYINSDVLSGEYYTLAEYLKGLDYKTAAFTGAYTLASSNLEQGFDRYEKVIPERMILDWDDWQLNHRDIYTSLDLFDDWFKDIKENDNFFVWIHINDTHNRMLNIAPDYVANSDDVLVKKGDILDFYKSEHYLNFEFSPFLLYSSFDELNSKKKTELLWDVTSRYDGAIQLVDNEISKLYKQFEERDFLEESLWIIVPDHGEGFGQHDFGGHGENVFEEQIRTPLIMHSPSMTKGHKPPYLAENVDILPTIAEIVGFDLTDEYEIDGESLLKYIREGKGKDYVFSMTPTNKAYSIQNEKYKYIYHDKEIIEWGEVVNKDMFFDLENDPYEQNNIIGTMPKIENEMKELILERAIESEI